MRSINSTINHDSIIIHTEFGYDIYYKISPVVNVDYITKYDDGLPDFHTSLNLEFVKCIKSKDAIEQDNIKTILEKRSLLSDQDYDHVQVGFIYADGDPNNHKWMLNFMDVNNKYLFGFIGDNVQLNCPFSTTSWEDGIWHGRMVINKKDITSLYEPSPGIFILNGQVTEPINLPVTPIKEDIDKLSLRYNTAQNTWYCDYLKNNKVLGSTPCKNIICDVPFVGKVDKNSSKPKVTAQLDIKNIKGTAIALNALIIKSK